MCAATWRITAACFALLVAITIGGAPGQRTRVVVDTDFGDDIDDTWALALILADSSIDLRLVVTDSYLPEKRAEVLARFLNRVGVAPPLAVGPGCCPDETKPLVLDGWAGPTDLAQYVGTVSHDAVSAIIREIALGASLGAITKLIVLSPCRAVALALQRAPWIAEHVEIYGMGGSIWAGNNGTAPPYAEWNIHADVDSARSVYGASWPVALPQLAPLDTAGLAQVGGDAFQLVYTCASPLATALIEMYAAWLPRCPWPEATEGPQGQADLSRRSSVVFDAVAASFVAGSSRFVAFATLQISIQDSGRTVIDPLGGHEVSAAIRWTDLPGWEDAVAHALCGDGHFIV